MPRGLIPEALVQQSELIVWSSDLASKHDSCAICHEMFNAATPDICRVLDCSHVFHAKCVDLWFIKATFCPLCKSDLKATYRHTSSQRSLGRSSHTSSQMSLGDRSHASSLRSGQILVGHSNSDPALLRILQESPYATLHRISPPQTPDRQHGSTASLGISFSDRSLPVMGSSRSERSLGILSSNSSGPLPAVQELSDEARLADVDSQQSHSSNPPSPLQQNSGGDDEQSASDDPTELWRPLIAEETEDADETLCSVVTATQLQQSTASNSELPYEREPSEVKNDSQKTPIAAPDGMASSGGAVVIGNSASSSSSQERLLGASLNSVLRNNSWMNSRSNVGLRSAVRSSGATLSKPVVSSDGNSTMASSSISNPVPSLSGYRRSAGTLAQPLQNDKAVHQVDELSATFPSSLIGTPPAPSVANPTSDSNQPHAGPLTAASSTANVSLISGLATPPSIGVATMSMSLSGQARNFPYVTFANSIPMVPTSQTGPTMPQHRASALPAMSPHQNNAQRQW